jgi:hypothetical protein
LCEITTVFTSFPERAQAFQESSLLIIASLFSSSSPSKKSYCTPAAMKFGRNLPRNVVPEWSASYIRYKALKKLIKSAAEDARVGKDSDLAGENPSLKT